MIASVFGQYDLRKIFQILIKIVHLNFYSPNLLQVASGQSFSECGTGAVGLVDGISGYMISCLIFVFLNLEISTIQK